MRMPLITLSVGLLAACATVASPPAEPPPPAACVIQPDLFAAGPQRERTLADMDDAARAALVLSLPDCLESPEPEVRDGYAYEVLSSTLRGGNVAPDTVRTLKAELLSRLASEDAAGFRQPFAALALAEVARTDRIEPWMSESERSDLIAAADAYLAGLADYRGFIDGEGWRHGVAHMADLLMQLSLNPELTRAQGEAVLSAVTRKVGTADHAYVFGESERLAAPVLYLARRDFFTPEEWTAWFAGLWPADDPLRAAAYSSEPGLAKLHNLRAFSQAVYVSAMASENPVYEPAGAAALQLLASLP
jgi:hypothetical protein